MRGGALGEIDSNTDRSQQRQYDDERDTFSVCACDAHADLAVVPAASVFPITHYMIERGNYSRAALVPRFTIQAQIRVRRSLLSALHG
jgi:hypothetical protein